jgi:hypothetical protein
MGAHELDEVGDDPGPWEEIVLRRRRAVGPLEPGMEQLTRRMADRSLELGGQDGNHVDRPHPRVELERGGDGGLASLTAVEGSGQSR